MVLGTTSKTEKGCYWICVVARISFPYLCGESGHNWTSWWMPCDKLDAQSTSSKIHGFTSLAKNAQIWQGILPLCFFFFLAPFFCRVSSRFWTVVLVSLQAIFAFLASPRCSTHGPSTTYVGSNFILFAGTLVFNTG